MDQAPRKASLDTQGALEAPMHQLGRSENCEGMFSKVAIGGHMA